MTPRAPSPSRIVPRRPSHRFRLLAWTARRWPVFGVAVLALLCLPWLVPGSVVARRVRQALRQRAGDRVSVAEARLLNWTGVRLYNVRIGDPKGEATWIVAPRVDVTFGLTDLFRAEPGPSGIRVEDPEIHLPASTLTPFHLAGLVTRMLSGKRGETKLRSVRIENGVLVARSAAGDRRVARFGLSAILGRSGVSLRCSVRPCLGPRSGLELAFRVRLSRVRSFEVQKRQAVECRLEDGAVTITRGRAERSLRLSPISGDLHLLGAPAPSIRFTGDCGAGREKAKVFALLEAPEGRPSLHADVRAGVVDVASARRLLAGRRAPSSVPVALAPLAALFGMRADARARIATLRGLGPEFHDIEAHIKSDGQGVTLDGLRVTFPGGSAEGRIEARSASPTQWQAKAGVQVRSLRTLRDALGSLSALGGSAPHGTGTIKADVTARGASATEVLRSLAGGASAEFRSLSFAREELPVAIRRFLESVDLRRVDLVDTTINVTARNGLARIQGASRLRFTPLRAYLEGEADLATSGFYVKISMTGLTELLAPGRGKAKPRRPPLFLITGMPLRVTRRF